MWGQHPAIVSLPAPGGSWICLCEFLALSCIRVSSCSMPVSPFKVKGEDKDEDMGSEKGGGKSRKSSFASRPNPYEVPPTKSARVEIDVSDPSNDGVARELFHDGPGPQNYAATPITVVSPSVVSVPPAVAGLGASGKGGGGNGGKEGKRKKTGLTCSSCCPNFVACV